MKIKSWGRVWALMVALGVLVSGCGPLVGDGVAAGQAGVFSPSPKPSKALLRDAKTVLRVGTGDSGDGLRPHQEIINRFEQANPDVLVQIEPVAGTDYYARLMAEIDAGEAPDIMQIGDDAVPMFVQKGALLDLGSRIKGKYPLDPNIYLPGVFQPGAWRGKQYLLPKDFSPLAVYYNKKLFDRYNVPYPKAGWTWDDFLKTAQALTRDTNGDGQPDVWGVQLPGAWPTGFEYWVAAAGGRLIAEDGKSFKGYMDGDAATSALDFYSSLYTHYKVAPPPADIKAFNGGNTEFADGQAAMSIFGRWPQSDLVHNGKIDLGVAPMPAGKKRANVLFWSGFGIYSGAAYPDAAWRFLRFYAGEQGAAVWKDWALPSVTSVAESSGFTRDPIEGVWLGELNVLAPRAYVFTPYWGETAEPALRKALERTITDPSVKPGDALKDAASQAQEALEHVR